MPGIISLAATSAINYLLKTQNVDRDRYGILLDNKGGYAGDAH